MTLIIRQHYLQNNRVIGDIILSDAASLNSLSLDMVRQMHTVLAKWLNMPEVVAVLLRGDGAHFCAGGNIRDLYQAMEHNDWAYVSAFFGEEYHLDYMIHRYPKPIIGWATGVTMGGGMGIFQGCGVRAVGGALRMAMPEAQIGIFPDVGAAWFLRRCPPPLGLFLGMSGTMLNTADAKYACLADYTLPADSAEQLLTALQNADWCNDNDKNFAVAHAAVSSLEEIIEESNLAAAAAEINACCHLSSATATYAALLQATHPWLQKTAVKMRNASLAAIMYWHQHWHTQQKAALAEVFAADYAAILTFCRHGDFAEGVRALLVDKGYQPTWRGHNDALPQWVSDILPADQTAADNLRRELTEKDFSPRF